MSGGGAGEAGLDHLPQIERQAGAIAWLPGPGPLRFVLVTSRRTRRWIFPKGAIEQGLTAPAAAETEALEEAGVIGRAAPDPVGSFRAMKIRPPKSWTIEVALFPLRIDEVLERWPEADERERRFVTLDEARPLLSDPDMLRLAERFLAGRS